jgi:hypothetical protein
MKYFSEVKKNHKGMFHATQKLLQTNPIEVDRNYKKIHLKPVPSA